MTGESQLEAELLLKTLIKSMSQNNRRAFYVFVLVLMYQVVSE